jgi:16S rRNA (adenine1518-N6/adenine1519-N6)-dimethyltransferase
VAQSKRDIQDSLTALGTHPKHRFGQNFMIDANMVRLIADSAALSSADTVIEVGPGTGTLTGELLARAGNVIAVEIDRDLSTHLRQHFADQTHFRLIEGDALAGKHELNAELLTAISSAAGPVKLVANLPYNIASPLVIDLLISGVTTLVFTVQKEVADRLRAGANEEAYGPLSVIVQRLSKVEVLRTLPPGIFWPPPKIDSALVRLTRDDQTEGRAREFSRFVQSVFSFRRKTLKRALTEAGHDAEPILQKTGFDPALRPETFSPEQFWQLFNAI